VVRGHGGFRESDIVETRYRLPHYQPGKILIRSDQPQAVARELEFEVRLRPDLPQAYYQFSRAYTLLGENRKSEQSLAAFAKLKKQEVDENKRTKEELQTSWAFWHASGPECFQGSSQMRTLFIHRPNLVAGGVCSA
jgi:hypothetical protein